METKFTYQIARQFENKGYFFGLDFFVREPENDVNVIFGDESIYPYFKECITSSFEIFNAFYFSANHKKLQLTVSGLMWRPVDCTPELIKYLVIRMLSDVFKVDFMLLLPEELKEKFHFLNPLTFRNLQKNIYGLRSATD